MIRIILILLLVLLFFAAVALSPMLIDEKGYILIAMGDITIESTVVTAIILLTVLFIALMIALKVFKGGLNISLGTWRKFSGAGRRRAEQNFRKGIAAYVLGDYQQAEQLLAKSADAGQQEETAYLVAAHAAQTQSMDSNANHYLAKLDQDTASQRSTNLESILVKLDILMTQHKLAEARALMDQHHTKIGHDNRLLAKEIELSLQELRFDNAISFIAKARKAKDVDTTKVQRWTQQAFEGKFNELLKQQSNDALHNYWQSLSRKDKQNDDIIIAYCHVLAKANINEPLEKLLVPVIKKGVNQTLINQIKLLPLHKPTALLSAVQKHLQSSPQNSLWLSCLGHLAASNQDWPLAERAFNSLLNSGDDTSQNDDVDIATFGHVLAAQGKFEQATKVLLAK